jgi:cell division protein FtsI (penicillin-binding protein 3)
VHEALEHSSDVAAVKLALKGGPDRFYQYIRDFGFGSRSGAELPGETRGLLRPVNKWGSSSIGSIAIGQEVASRRCNWSRWFRPSPTAESTCRRTC